MPLKLVVAVCLLVCSTGTLRADWPEFRGPTKDGIVTGIDLPTEWSPEQNVRWRTELPGEGWSSPIVVGGAIYLTAAIPTDNNAPKTTYDLALLILDVQTGKLTNQVSLFTQDADAPKIHSKNSHASPTPVCDGKHLYVHFGHQGTSCTTLEGEIVWKNESLKYPPVHGNGGSPAIVDDLLIFSRDGRDISVITALDKTTGQVAWQTERDAIVDRQFSFATPLVIETDGRRQLILPGSNVVQSVDPQTGAEHWRLSYDGYSVIPRPIYESGLVFVCTGYDTPSILAIDPTGSGDVTKTHLVWQSKRNIPKTPSLIGYDGKIAMISDKGIASCFEAQTGKVLWTERIGGNFSASPILVGKNLYLLSEDGVCTILDVSGEPKEVAVNQLNERSLASPAVVEQDLLIRTDAALYRISDK